MFFFKLFCFVSSCLYLYGIILLESDMITDLYLGDKSKYPLNIKGWISITIM